MITSVSHLSKANFSRIKNSMFFFNLSRCVLLILLICTQENVFSQRPKIYFSLNGTVSFRSDAPQELIKAESKELKGAIETATKTFSFKIRISSFEGFNSGLQRIHFNENYMESAVYPEASFKGKIIEDIDFNKDGRYEIRAKGILNIHGIDQERIIKSELMIKQAKMYIQSAFTVLLPDYNIPIPRIVKDKLAQEIKVTIQALLEPK